MPIYATTAERFSAAATGAAEKAVENGLVERYDLISLDILHSLFPKRDSVELWTEVILSVMRGEYKTERRSCGLLARDGPNELLVLLNDMQGVRPVDAPQVGQPIEGFMHRGWPKRSLIFLLRERRIRLQENTLTRHRSDSVEPGGGLEHGNTNGKPTIELHGCVELILAAAEPMQNRKSRVATAS